MTNPTPAQVVAARLSVGHTQTEAAKCVGYGVASWQRWEYGVQPMRLAVFENYLLKSGAKNDI